ncbi:TonB-dependent receptor [Steroidobacter sp. S1-65]|uniref:TonB-dependent receptor n=1 Tax=Steroidobacter gossypii TaxID=2805490 RepID=A0ABS1WX02_9GAMM|nr:TonB-dependent receptor [Steroidobacter gossypii]MBM0105498.1 TonB-dependent receptor [Steroidobacter gossypii]
MNARKTTARLVVAVAVIASFSAVADNVIIRDPTFEELASLTVTSVTGTARPHFTSPAATHILTAEELHQLGLRSIPDALRYAPGMQVSQLDSYRWSVSARGFNSIAVDKLLVLVDGRSVYTPLSSGVYWEQNAGVHHDLDRIEVIRGPAGSVWGANAVNGVVNILSKSARETQGTALTVGTGTEEQAFGSFRYGGAAGENAWYRAYVNYSRHDDSELGNGRATGDGWEIGHVGVRYDREGPGSRLFFKAEAHSGDFEEPGQTPAPTPPYETSIRDGFNRGGFVQASWSQRLTNGAEFAIGAWYERLERRLQPIDERSDTVDLGVRYGTQLGDHTVNAGALYRYVDHQTSPSFALTFSPPDHTLHQWSGYLQDEIQFAPRFSATLGVRLEDAPFTGREWQPNVRLRWSIADEHSLWAAVGRAVRTPGIADESRNYTIRVFPPGRFGPGSPPVRQQVLGSPGLKSEVLLAYEVGWRGRWSNDAMFSVSAFYNDYDRLMLFAPQALDTVTLAPEFWRLPLTPNNAGSGQALGAEFTAMWRPTLHWRLFSEVSYLDLKVLPSEYELARVLTGSSAQLQASVRSYIDLGQDWEIGLGLRYVDELPALNVDSFMDAELRVAKQLSQGVKLALVGKNLWQSRHAEFRSGSFPLDSYIERSVYLALTWRR